MARETDTQRTPRTRRRARPAVADPRPDRRALSLWCGACGRALSCTRELMLGYVRDGWPGCCGREMGFFPGTPPETNNPAR